MKKEIRPYQREAIDTVKKKLQKAKSIVRGMLVMATGTGKTFTAVRTIAELKFKKVLWITHTEELVDQSAKALIYEYFGTDTDFHPEAILDNYADVIDFKAKNQSAFGLFNQSHAEQLINQSFGIIKAERMDIEEPLIIASIQTLHRRLAKLPQDMFDCIVIDECDLAGAKTWMKVLDHFTPKLLLGLTATPYRTDNMLLSNLFDETLYEYTIEQGIEDGFLCELDAIRIRTDLSLDNVGSQGGDFKTGELEQVVNTPKRNNLIVDSYEKYALGRQFMGFCVDIQHAKDLTNTFKNRGYSNVDFVVGDKQETTDRKGTISRFKSGELLGLNNVMVLTVGFDYSEVSCLLKACPTKSKRKYVQGAGRGTRLKKGKFQDCIILDFVDNTRKHTLINTETLDEGKTFENKIFLTKKKKAMLIDQREKRKFKAETKTDEKVNLFKLPPPPKIYHSGRNLEEATIGQINWIKREGFDTENIVYTKAMCSEIISGLPEWDKTKISIVKNNGYDIAGITIGQCASALKEIETRKLTNSKIILPFNDL